MFPLKILTEPSISLALVYSLSVSFAIILYLSLFGKVYLLNWQVGVRQFKERNTLQAESAA